MPFRSLTVLAALAFAAPGLLAGCENGDDPPRTSQEGVPAPSRVVNTTPRPHVADTRPLECAVGRRPGYFVPASPHTPLALLGCARLGLSGKRADVSAGFDRIEGEPYLCLIPAYKGHGSPGVYQPTICSRRLPSRFDVWDVSQPLQAVRDYGLVVWGTAGAGAAKVLARYGTEATRAVVFEVGPKLAARFGEQPFSVFIAELPLGAACGWIRVTVEPAAASRRVGPRGRICDRVA